MTPAPRLPLAALLLGFSISCPAPTADAPHRTGADAAAEAEARPAGDPHGGAAPGYRRAALLAAEALLEAKALRPNPFSFPFGDRLDEPAIAATRDFLVRLSPALDLLRQAAPAEDADWNEAEGEGSHEALIRRIWDFRSPLIARAELRRQAGDLAGALEDADTLLRLSRHIMLPSSGPTWTAGFLFGYGFASMGHLSAARLAATPEGAALVEAWLAAAQPYPAASIAGQGVRLELDEIVQAYSAMLEGLPEEEKKFVVRVPGTRP